MKQSMPPGSDWERAGDAARSRGQVAVVLLVGVVIATVFMLVGFEFARLSSRHLEAQNAADGAARAAATWQARGLNVIGTANIAQALLMLEFVLPVDGMRAFDPELGAAGREIAALQDTVARLFPGCGVFAASASARWSGADPLTASDLREAGLPGAADWLEGVAASGTLGRLLAGALYAAPMGRADQTQMLGLGVHRADDTELASLAAAFLENEDALSLLFESFSDPIFGTRQAPVLFFGDHGPGDYSLTRYPGAAEDVMQLIYRRQGGGVGRESVLTYRGIGKLRRALGAPPRTIRIGVDQLEVVPAEGPLTPATVAAWFGMSESVLRRTAIELAFAAARDDPAFGFSFHVFDSEFWSSGGASAAMATHVKGLRSRGVGGRRPSTLAFSRAAPVAAGESSAGMVLPIFESAGLRPLGNIREGVGTNWMEGL